MADIIEFEKCMKDHAPVVDHCQDCMTRERVDILARVNASKVTKTYRNLSYVEKVKLGCWIPAACKNLSAWSTDEKWSCHPSELG